MTRTAAPSIRDLAVPGSWVERAACRDVEPEAFWPAHDDSPEPLAEETCARCPVRTLCLLWAIDNAEPFGYWGGHTAGERVAIKAEMDRRLRVPAGAPRCGACGSRRCSGDQVTCDDARDKRHADV
jgi:WhiB family redox-sensing transcriptional regulator